MKLGFKFIINNLYHRRAASNALHHPFGNFPDFIIVKLLKAFIGLIQSSPLQSNLLLEGTVGPMKLRNRKTTVRLKL